MKSIEWRIRPGRMLNEEEVVRSLKEVGYFRGGPPRSKETAAQKSATTAKNSKLPPQEPNRLSDERRST